VSICLALIFVMSELIVVMIVKVSDKAEFDRYLQKIRRGNE